MALDFMDDASPHDVAEFVFDAREVIPLSDLADSFSALDRLFAKQSKTGARLAVAEIRKGSIVAVLAPYVPIMGQAVSMMSSAMEVTDFVKRVRDGLSAFAGHTGPAPSAPTISHAPEAAELAEIVKPLAGRNGKLGVAHIKYRSQTGDRIVEVEATFKSSEIDRIALNAARAAEEELLAPPPPLPGVEPTPTLLRKVALTLQQTNTGPAKERGKTSDRAVVEAVSLKPLPVYFAKTLVDLKQKMIGRAANPFRQPFRVDVLVTYEDGEPKFYTVIDVHGASRMKKPKGPPDLLSGMDD